MQDEEGLSWRLRRAGRTKFPDWEQPIRDYYGRWTEMLKGPIHESVDIGNRKKVCYRIYALTNWQSGLFDNALVQGNFMHWFDGR